MNNQSDKVNIANYRSIGINIATYQSITSRISEYQSIVMSIPKNQCITIRIEKYQSIVLLIFKYKRIVISLTLYQTIKILISIDQSYCKKLQRYCSYPCTLVTVQFFLYHNLNNHVNRYFTLFCINIFTKQQVHKKITLLVRDIILKIESSFFSQFSSYLSRKEVLLCFMKQF